MKSGRPPQHREVLRGGGCSHEIKAHSLLKITCTAFAGAGPLVSLPHLTIQYTPIPIPTIKAHKTRFTSHCSHATTARSRPTAPASTRASWASHLNRVRCRGEA